MKKRILLFACFLIFFQVSFISAVEIKLSKDSYQPRETLFAEISGSFLEGLKIDNILLYKDGTPREMPSKKDILRKNDVYYFYVILPNQEGNYSLHIEDVSYIEFGESKSDPIIKDFSVNQTKSPALSIDPGFIFTSDTFEISLTGLYQSQDVHVNFLATNYSSDFFLSEESIKTLSFSVKGLSSQDSEIKINDYSIPVFIVTNVKDLNCSENNGVICPQNYTCNGSLISSSDSDNCCLGDCINENECVHNCSIFECGDDNCGGVCGNCTELYDSSYWCNNHVCINDTKKCINECEKDKIVCEGNILKYCGNFNQDSCLEWGNITDCMYGCENLSCVDPRNPIDLRFQSFSLNSNLLRAKILADKTSEPLELFLENTGKQDLKDITLTASFPAEFNPETLDLNSGENTTISFTVKLSKDDVDEKNHLIGRIFANVDDKNFSFPVFIGITFNVSKVDYRGASSQNLYSCSDIGKICPENKKCSNDTVRSLEGPCCPGECVEESSGGSGWFIWILLILVIAGVSYFLYKRTKNPTKKTTPEKILKKKGEDFENRMQGLEVNHSLTKT